MGRLDFTLEFVYTKRVYHDDMHFSWGENKRVENWRTRKVDFAEAVGTFEAPEILESPDDHEDYGDARLRALGESGGVFYLVVYTWRGDTRHIITAWKVGEDGKRRYEALFAQRRERDEGKG